MAAMPLLLFNHIECVTDYMQYQGHTSHNLKKKEKP